MRKRRPGKQTKEEASPPRVVDPTSQLLGEITDVESKVPWVALGITLVCVIWLPLLLTISDNPLRGYETEWIAEALTPWESGSASTAFARTLSAATWEWQGLEVADPGSLSPLDRARVRLPAMAAGLAALLVFFFLGRMTVGPAAALFGACMLAVAIPFRDAGTSALPFMVGQLLVLLGVTWAIQLQSRHREVEVAGVNATRMGIAGIFLGVGLQIAPTTFATFLTTLLIWFLLGLRRASSRTTTLPVDSPRVTMFFAGVGAIVLAAAAYLSALTAEILIGGRIDAFPAPWPSIFAWDLVRVENWKELYDGLLAPSRNLSIWVGLSVPFIVAIRAVEWSTGKPWQAAGLAPWVFLGGYLWLAMQDGVADRFDLPLTVPPLFVLGLGWLVLRGIQPGRSHRQEYTFLLTWLIIGLLLAPIVAAGRPNVSSLLTAKVALLPVYILTAARGARALWEAEEGPLSRIAILLIGYLPLLVFFLGNAAQLAGAEQLVALAEELNRFILPVLLGAVALGVLSEFIHVRPDDPVATTERGGGRGRRRRSGGGSRGAGGASGGSRRGGRGGRGGSGRGGSNRGGSGRGGGDRSGGGRRRSGSGGSGGERKSSSKEGGGRRGSRGGRGGRRSSRGRRAGSSGGSSSAG